jgi:hypothetical protein
LSGRVAPYRVGDIEPLRIGERVHAERDGHEHDGHEDEREPTALQCSDRWRLTWKAAFAIS